MKATLSTIPSTLFLGLALTFTATHRANCQWPPPWPPSPVNTIAWDALVSGGGQRGIAFLFFGDDQSVSGYQLLAPKPPSKDSYQNRTPYGDIGRYDQVTGTNGITTKTNLYGFGQIRGGSWGYDERGRIVGSYAMFVDKGTNGIVPYPFTFTGKVVPGKHMVLVTQCPNGKLTYSARPYIQRGVDLSGNWYSTRKTGGQALTDFFPVVPVPETDSLYSVDQTVFYSDEIGYTLNGVVLFSSQRKVGFAFTSTPFDLGSTNEVSGTMFATYGSVSRSSRGILKASTTGVQDPYDKVTMNAVWQSALPVESTVAK